MRDETSRQAVKMKFFVKGLKSIGVSLLILIVMIVCLGPLVAIAWLADQYSHYFLVLYLLWVALLLALGEYINENQGVINMANGENAKVNKFGSITEDEAGRLVIKGFDVSGDGAPHSGLAVLMAIRNRINEELAKLEVD